MEVVCCLGRRATPLAGQLLVTFSLSAVGAVVSTAAVVATESTSAAVVVSAADVVNIVEVAAGTGPGDAPAGDVEGWICSVAVDVAVAVAMPYS